MARFFNNKAGSGLPSSKARFLFILFGFLSTVVGSAAVAATATEERPNILFILTDDQNFQALGVSGNDEIKTPNLDKLAQSGTQFTHVYNQGSWSPAVCAPSRAMINTGRNLYETGMVDQKVDREQRPSYPLWGETFRNAGYETFLTGKWHVSRGAMQRSFDSGKAVLEGGMTHDHYKAMMVDMDRNNQVSEAYPSVTHTSELIANAAVEFLENKPKQKNDKPFFMYVGFLAPHDARQSPQSYMDMYPGKDITLPKSFRKQNTVDQGDFWVRDEMLLPLPRQESQVKDFIAEYYAMVTHLDAQIGRILDTLEKSQYAKNTIIVFTSDHGIAIGKHGLLGKQNQYDHSVRAPFVIAGKGIAKNRKARGNFYLNSLFPTTAELAGIKVPSTVQSKSVASLLDTSKPDSANDYIYGAYRHYQRMVRSDDFKLIYYPVIGVTQLFDMKNDPNELVNLASNPKYAKQLTHLRGKLKELMTELKDPLDFADPAKSYKKAGFSVKPWTPRDKKLN